MSAELLVNVPSIGGQQRATPALAAKYERMLAAARADGIAAPFLLVASGYRSIERQRALWEASDKSGDKVASPGGSEHNAGEALDLWLGDGTGNTDESPRLLKTAAAAWLGRNAARFGLRFYNRELEPWHVEDDSNSRNKAAVRARVEALSAALAGSSGSSGSSAQRAALPPTKKARPWWQYAGLILGGLFTLAAIEENS